MKYYASLPEAPSKEIESVLNYLRTNPIAVFPYDFQNQFVTENIEVFDDHAKGLRYVYLIVKDSISNEDGANKKSETFIICH